MAYVLHSLFIERRDIMKNEQLTDTERKLLMNIIMMELEKNGLTIKQKEYLSRIRKEMHELNNWREIEINLN